MDHGKCGECMFWEKGGVGGHCKRYPPKGTSLDGMNGYPFTSSDTWCGEYRSRSMRELELKSLNERIRRNRERTEEFFDKYVKGEGK